jgi:hypothetical protein
MYWVPGFQLTSSLFIHSPVARFVYVIQSEFLLCMGGSVLSVVRTQSLISVEYCIPEVCVPST